MVGKQLPSTPDHTFSPPPSNDIQLYVKKPLPALPRRNSVASTFSKEMDQAFATPDGTPPSTADNQLVDETGDIDWASQEAEIALILDQQIGNMKGSMTATAIATAKALSPSIPDRTDNSQSHKPRIGLKSLLDRRLPPESEVLPPNSRLSLQKVLRLSTTTFSPAGLHAASPGPTGHNSGQKIKQLMGVDVAPLENNNGDSPRQTFLDSPVSDKSSIYSLEADTTISDGDSVNPLTPVGSGKEYVLDAAATDEPIRRHKRKSASGGSGNYSLFPRPLNPKSSRSATPDVAYGDRKTRADLLTGSEQAGWLLGGTTYTARHSHSRSAGHVSDLYHDIAGQLAQSSVSSPGHSHPPTISESPSSSPYRTTNPTASQDILTHRRILSDPPRSSSIPTRPPRTGDNIRGVPWQRSQLFASATLPAHLPHMPRLGEEEQQQQMPRSTPILGSTHSRTASLGPAIGRRPHHPHSPADRSIFEEDDEYILSQPASSDNNSEDGAGAGAGGVKHGGGSKRRSLMAKMFKRGSAGSGSGSGSASGGASDSSPAAAANSDREQQQHHYERPHRPPFYHYYYGGAADANKRQSLDRRRSRSVDGLSSGRFGMLATATTLAERTNELVEQARAAAGIKSRAERRRDSLKGQIKVLGDGRRVVLEDQEDNDPTLARARRVPLPSSPPLAQYGAGGGSGAGAGAGAGAIGVALGWTASEVRLERMGGGGDVLAGGGGGEGMAAVVPVEHRLAGEPFRARPWL